MLQLGPQKRAARRWPLARRPPWKAPKSLLRKERVNVAVYDACNRSVVNIKTEASTTSMFLLDLVQEGTGSGSVLDDQGHILTNYHVVEGAKEIQVTLFDSKDYPARVVAKDASTDVAILKIERATRIALSGPLWRFDTFESRAAHFCHRQSVWLERTLTTGVVSSLDRTLPSRSNRTIKSVIQVDAAINPGNSGGPLLDTHSRLIGMNTAIASKNRPKHRRRFRHPFKCYCPGRARADCQRPRHSARHGITKVYETDKGLLIAAVQSGGPAEQAGLRGFKLTKERKRQGPFVYEATSIDRNAADIITAVTANRR